MEEEEEEEEKEKEKGDDDRRGTKVMRGLFLLSPDRATERPSDSHQADRYEYRPTTAEGCRYTQTIPCLFLSIS